MMDRRTFLKTFAAGVVGSRFFDPTNLLSAPANDASVLAVVRGTDAGAITREAVDALGGMSSFVARGDAVIVKPNIGWDRTPEQAANTNPDVVGTLVELAYHAGAKRVSVFDNTCNASKRCYRRSGIAQAAERAGAEVLLLDEGSYTTTDLRGESIGEWPVCSEAMEADKIINVPIAKHHSLSRLTLSMKNLMGLIGGRRNLLHENLDTNIVDLAAFFKPTLVVLDAVRVLTANGPQGGNLRDVKTLNRVAASRDQVAIDAFGVGLFDMEVKAFPHIRKANKRGLGAHNLDSVKIIERSLS